MKKQPKKPRIKRFLMAAVAAAGLSTGAFFGNGGDMSADFNSKATANDPPAVSAVMPELSNAVPVLRAEPVPPGNVIYYEDRVQAVDRIEGMAAAMETQGPIAQKKVYSITVVPLEKEQGQHPVTIVPLIPPGGPAP